MNLGTPLPETELMANFKPIRAWRYSPRKTEMVDVIAPPYDVITPEQQAELYRRSPLNCIRLILNRGDDKKAGEDRYAQAAAFFRKWQREGVLVQEEEPSYYLYRQTFRDLTKGCAYTRSALLGRLKLEPFERGVVVPHEKTLSRPKADRKKLLEAVHANFSPIFGLFDDECGEWEDCLETAVRGRTPLFEVTDESGVIHRVWQVADEPALEKIHRILSEKQIFIADGHHRYQTALDHSREIRKTSRAAEGKELPSDYVLTALVRFQDPGLRLFPTHRIIDLPDGLGLPGTLEALKPYFDVEREPLEKLSSRLENEGRRREKSGQDRPVFGLVLKDGETFFLTLRDPEGARRLMPSGKPDIWYHQDVNVLNYLMLRELWKIPEKNWESVLKYTHHLPAAIEAVQKKQAAAAVLLSAPPVRVLRDMGNIGELMPQKSTYFYPKLASGIVFYDHDAAL